MFKLPPPVASGVVERNNNKTKLYKCTFSTCSFLFSRMRSLCIVNTVNRHISSLIGYALMASCKTLKGHLDRLPEGKSNMEKNKKKKRRNRSAIYLLHPTASNKKRTKRINTFVNKAKCYNNVFFGNSLITSYLIFLAPL